MVVVVVGYERKVMGMDNGIKMNNEMKKQRRKKTCENVCCKNLFDDLTSRIKPVKRGDGGFVILIFLKFSFLF